jgi:opacity protein-like surface antigen
MKKMVLITTILTTSLLSTTHAESGFYATASLGQAELQEREELSGSKEVDNTSFSLGAGYQINEYLAIEASYSDYGKGSTQFTSGEDFNESARFLEMSSTSINATLKGNIPIAKSLDLIVGLGVSRWEPELYYRIPDYDMEYAQTDEDTETFYKYGIEYQLSDNFDIGLERYSLKHDDARPVFKINNTALYLNYHF